MKKPKSGGYGSNMVEPLGGIELGEPALVDGGSGGGGRRRSSGGEGEGLEAEEAVAHGVDVCDAQELQPALRVVDRRVLVPHPCQRKCPTLPVLKTHPGT